MLDFSNQADVTTEMRGLQSKYQVSGFPTLVIVRPSGKVRGKKVGFGGDADAYIAELKRTIGK